MKFVAKVVVFDAGGNALLIRRTVTHPLYPHHWDIPGGEADANESSEQAAVRELEEETGIITTTDKLELVFDKKVTDDTSYVLYTLSQEKFMPDIRLSWEHDIFEWLSPKGILSLPTPTELDPFYGFVLDWLAARGGIPS